MPMYSPEEMRQLIKTLPEDLKEALFAEETANRIGEICERHDISGDRIQKLAGLVGDVLTGLLPPENLDAKLEKELNLESEEAKDIAREVSRFILFSVKRSLNKLYNEEFFSAAGAIESEKTSADDAYREPVKEESE